MTVPVWRCTYMKTLTRHSLDNLKGNTSTNIMINYICIGKLSWYSCFCTFFWNKNLVSVIMLLTSSYVIFLTLKPSFCRQRANLRAPSFASSSLNKRGEQEWAPALTVVYIRYMIWHEKGDMTHKQQLETYRVSVGSGWFAKNYNHLPWCQQLHLWCAVFLVFFDKWQWANG